MGLQRVGHNWVTFIFWCFSVKNPAWAFPLSQFLTFNTVDVLEQRILCCGGSFVHFSMLRSTPRFHPPNGSILPFTPLVMINHVFRCWLRFQRGQIPPPLSSSDYKIIFPDIAKCPRGWRKQNPHYPPPSARQWKTPALSYLGPARICIFPASRLKSIVFRE